jgi:hypothetical protein
MRRGIGWVLFSAWLLASCTGRAEAVRAAQPYIEDFGDLRLRALSLLELRADVERQQLLLKAMNGDEEGLPDNLRPLLERMRAEGVQIDDKQIAHGQALFWRILDYTFSESPNVLQAEIVFLEKGGSTSVFRHPRERELPAGVKWYGLRQQRTFAGLTNCVTEGGSEPCVLLQLRPRDYSGSAGLTVAYRRTPVEVTDDAESDR